MTRVTDHVVAPAGPPHPGKERTREAGDLPGRGRR